jgi:hypothetical protein
MQVAAIVSPGALLLMLPSGEALVSAVTLPAGPASKSHILLYVPDGGSPATQWAPSIANAPANVVRGNTYAISGTQFNGLSQAQAFGDELVAATNYPLVRISNDATGHVTYARTHDHSTMAVATGNTSVATKFDVPASIEPGASHLVVVANGISSAPASILVSDAKVPFAIQPGITGNWFNAAQSGHGFEIEVLPTTPPQLFAFWFVFAPDGGQTWIGGTGEINGDHASVQAYQVNGAGALFPPHFDAANTASQPWGTLTFTFTDCNNGQVSWNSSPAYGNGTLPITRLTMPAGLHCH